MTTVTTAIPSMYQLPTALNLAQLIGVIGVIIHGDHSSEVVHRKHCTFWIAQLRGARALWTFWQWSHRSSPCSACSFIERRWSAALIIFALMNCALENVRMAWKRQATGQEFFSKTVDVGSELHFAGTWAWASNWYCIQPNYWALGDAYRISHWWGRDNSFWWNIDLINCAHSK